MRAAVTAIVLCVLLQACGSKGALILPPEKQSGEQQSSAGKQK
jgi:predicted small lipoprotein YifL